MRTKKLKSDYSVENEKQIYVRANFRLFVSAWLNFCFNFDVQKMNVFMYILKNRVEK
jgi:uncharacterized protein YqiB (DUF1249 family)